MFSNSRSILLTAICVLGFCGWVSSSRAQVTQEWVARYDGPMNYTDIPHGLALDDEGNVYVTGSSDWPYNRSHYMTIKYNNNGQVLWSDDYTGSNPVLQSYAYGVAVDQQKNVVVTGMVNYSMWDTSAAIATIKYDSLGQILWTRTYDTPGTDDWANRMVMDPAGNIYIAGSVGPYFLTLKYNAGGQLMWNAIFADYFGYGAFDIILDSQGNVYVTGTVGVAEWIWGTVKYNPQGVQQWVALYDGQGGWLNTPRCLAVDSQDNIVVAGDYAGSNGETHCATVKYNSQGQQQWAKLYTGPGDSVDWLNEVIVDEQDNIYVTGGSWGGATGIDCITIKYTPSGVQQWMARYTSAGDSLDLGVDLAIDSMGNAYVCGTTAGHSPATEGDYLLAKYNTQGQLLWTQRYTGNPNANYPDGAFYIALDQQLNIYITGESMASMYIPPQNNDWATIKYSQSPLAPLDVTLTPVNPPIVIPANGGSFQYNASVVNYGPNQQPFYVWARIKNPDGTYTPPTLDPFPLNPPVGQSLTRLRTQMVPAPWPPGVYTYLGYANWTNTYPAVDSSWFTFTKSITADGGPWITDVTCSGEPFPGEEIPPLSRGDNGDLVGVSPNPFNPAMAISYQLQAASQVSLKVYDTAGRLVATLVDGQQEAGRHSVTFDGSKLASGVYLYRLSAGPSNVSGKMVLLK